MGDNPFTPLMCSFKNSAWLNAVVINFPSMAKIQPSRLINQNASLLNFSSTNVKSVLQMLSVKKPNTLYKDKITSFNWIPDEFILHEKNK